MNSCSVLIKKPCSTSRGSHTMLESVSKLSRTAMLIFYICENSFLKSRQLTPLLSPWVLTNGWQVLAAPPRICRLFSPLVLWCHQPGPGHPNVRTLSESQPTGLPPASVTPQPSSSWAWLSAVTLFGRKLKAHRTSLCLFWDRASHSAGAHSFCSFCFPLTKIKIPFHCSLWVLFP